MLKLSKIIFAFSLLLFLNSCASDDEATTDPADLIGTWTAISFDADVSSTTSVAGIDVTSATTAMGSNFSYDLTFTETTFTTSGGYDVETSGTANGIAIPASTSSYTNVAGNGTYTSDNTTLTLDGSFFTFEFDGMDLSALGEAQTVDYEINSNDELIISQNETMTTTVAGATVTSVVVSNSVWKKQ